eukprot:1080050_1
MAAAVETKPKKHIEPKDISHITGPRIASSRHRADPEEIVVKGPWLDVRDQAPSAREELVTVFSEISVVDKNGKDLRSYSCNPCRVSYGKWTMKTPEEHILVTGRPEVLAITSVVPGEGNPMATINKDLRKTYEAYKAGTSTNYIVFSPNVKATDRKVFYAPKPTEPIEAVGSMSSAAAHSGYYNDLDYRSLFDEPVPPIYHYENGLQLAQV